MAFIKHQPDDSVSLDGVFRLNSSFITKADGTEPFSGNQSMGGFQLTNLGTPVAGTSAANKEYVDNLVYGLSWKTACRVATTANITLSGLLVIDDVTLVENDRVLVKDKTLQKDNGIYVASAGAWVRSDDANTADALESATVTVKEGTVNAETRWTQTNDNFIIGTDPVTWVFIGGAPTDGIYAATRIVSPIADEGTDTTIAAALAALPAEGGLIFIKQGVYPISATITLPDKPVKIVGCGKGITIIDIGSNVIAAFTAGFSQQIHFEGFSITGSGAVGQQGFLYTFAGTTDKNLTLRDVETGLALASGAIETAIAKTSGGYKNFHVENCQFLMTSTATGKLLDNGGSGNFVFSGIRTGGNAAISGGPTVYMTDCTLTTENLAAFAVGAQSTFNDCDFLGTAAGAVGTSSFSTGSTGKFVNCRFTDTVTLSASGWSFIGCLLTTTTTRSLDLTSGATDTRVAGCSFTGFSSEAIRIASTGCVITGNRNCKVLETGAANSNRYSNNSVFDGSTIIGEKSFVDGENVQTIAATITLDGTYSTIRVDASGAARTMDLPAAALYRYKKYTVKKIEASANAVIVDPFGAELIDDVSTFNLTVKDQSVTFISNGTGWDIV